jgi:hypothetical protein
MFKPNAEHIEELMRAKEICESLIDEIQDDDYSFLMSRARLKKSSELINQVLDKLTNTIEALTP